MYDVGTRLTNNDGLRGIVTDYQEDRYPQYTVSWDNGYTENCRECYVKQYVMPQQNESDMTYAKIENPNSVKAIAGSIRYKFWVCYSEPLGFEVFADYNSCERNLKELASRGIPCTMLENIKTALPKDIEWITPEEIPF